MKHMLPTARARVQARRTVSLCMWGISGAVVSGAGGYWYLSYVYLSWDIMVRTFPTYIVSTCTFLYVYCSRVYLSYVCHS